MKIRKGFVSNSSSTSFTFVFKGDTVKDLSDTIWKYKKHFSLRHNTGWSNTEDVVYTCNAQEVAEAIERCVETTKDKEWDIVKIISIEDHIEQLVARIKELDVYIKAEKGKYIVRYSETEKQNLKKDIEQLRCGIKNGLTSVLVIGFGDNDGNVSGVGLGTVMDYEGRMIDIKEKDFLVLIEQNR